VKGPGPDRGVVFQSFALFPWRTVLDNVAFGPKMRGIARPERERIAHEYLALAKLTEAAGRYPNELSGGMQQRVAICRALLCTPTLLLMDEPFAALDALTREELSIELLRIWQHEPKTVLFVTHSIPEAILLADEVVIISSRPGRIVRTLPIELPRPRALSAMQTTVFQDYAATIRNAISKKP